ncbi:hypothetical protein JYT19_00395 [Sulfobacillus acidophilus]|uniref:Prenyltransferase n=1 Tax=Sulfobacillus acidophilus TaxID=53633 RepID=A0ABS3AW79_9FIRM|nr:hypothetical protein [Sulfobacillus acidophilus]
MAETKYENSPTFKRMLLWANERFPLSHALLFFIMFFCAFVYGKVIMSEGPIALKFEDFFGFFATWAFFLLLRIFDEHKDYEIDCKNYPNRVLQSGLITLNNLKVLGALAILCQVLVSTHFDQGIYFVTKIWLVTFLYSVLMAKEFFIGKWLEKRLVLYAFSHLLIMPFALLWMAQMASPKMLMSTEIWPLLLLAFLSGAAFEITRKTKGPSEEKTGVDSYSKILGAKLSSFVIFLLLLSSLAVQIYVVESLFKAESLIPVLVLNSVFITACFGLYSYIKSPSIKGRKINEALVSLSMLVAYVVLTAVAILDRGVLWL